ncbi:sex-determining region Y protein, sry [Tritrichomonas foetus]|uniref:Sex-determining region Y protein, sry n=1 Tax=Tritrichomonas foetus TaxID=1144522 RepID=A0A1J4J5J5_9EUKA|nr:sex-determining region Y protein, sry [Tritrichomonas foetus]|eukprot:OHS93415.1 sex-determining region Y protein, sry [Tritrichomonas foetus]
MEQVFLDGFDMPMTAMQDQMDDAPKKKRPANAFIRFCLENRKLYRDSHPGMSNIEISSLLATEWNKLTEEQKNPYKISAQEEQKKFKEENPQYGYDKAKQKRSAKKSSDFPKQHFDIPDINTLVSLPPEELRQCLSVLQNQVLLQYLQIQNIVPESDVHLHMLEETLSHSFQNPHH